MPRMRRRTWNALPVLSFALVEPAPGVRKQRFGGVGAAGPRRWGRMRVGWGRDKPPAVWELVRYGQGTPFLLLG